MKITIDYLQGIVDTTLDFFEDVNGRIHPDKDLNIWYEPIKSSNSESIVGCKIQFVWKTWVSNKTDKDSTLTDNYLKVYNNDRLSGVISDLSDIFNEISNSRLEY